MTGSTNKRAGFRARLRSAWNCLIGATPAVAPVADTTPAGELQSTLARLRLDIEEKDEKIRRMQEEFGQLRANAERETAEAREGALAKLVKKAGPQLSQIATMRAMLAAGTDIRTADVFSAFEILEQSFAEVGCKPVGAVGQQVAFDPKLYQRMSGGSLGEGDEVVVRFVGYALNGDVVVKAMVSRKEAGRGTGD